MTTFNLIDEPWIFVRDHAGAKQEVSIRQALAEAHRWRDLQGDMPTQSVALLRLLMAIIWRSLPDDEPMELWGELWAGGRFDRMAVESYLARYHDRFDLLDRECPFYQVAQLRTAKGDFTSLSRLIADLPAGEQFFTTRGPSSFNRLGFAESARWLVHANAFDPSGIKSGALGDPRVKGGKGYPQGQAWCGWLGLIVLEGDSLFETIMLNLALELSTDRDSAVWERDPLGPASDGRAAPAGPVDLLTWSSRRVRFDHDDAETTGVLICYGDPLHPRNQDEFEPMTSWRRSAAQEKAHGLARVMMPREHQSDRAVWRGLSGMLATGLTSGEGLRAANLNHVASAVQRGFLASDKVVRTRAVGMIYGTQSAVTDDVIDDLLAVQSAVLADPSLRALAVDAVSDVDRLAKITGRFSEDLARAAGRESDDFRAGREEIYAAVDPHYRAWLRTLGERTDIEEARCTWQTILVDLARPLHESLARQAGREALIGRVHDERPINTALAQVWARAAVRKELPHARHHQPKSEPTGQQPERSQTA